jgi:hypothetical protein
MQLLYRPPRHSLRQAASTRVRAAIAVLLVCCASPADAEQPTIPPDWSEVTLAVEAYFLAVPDYRAGDLVSQSHVAAVLAELEVAGWKMTDGSEVVELALPDDSFLVARFATPAGRRFIRKIAGEPGAYSRLDRLTSISRGQKLVNDLIRLKGGDELIRYLATEKGGHELGRQMAATPGGVDLNEPTGRIYTADDLIGELRLRWEASR